MKSILIFSIVFMTNIALFGQKVDYTIPKGYEIDINSKDYKTLVDAAILVITKRYKVDFVKEGTIHLVKNEDLQEMNLHNLIGKCVVFKDKSKWKQVIEEHCNGMFSTIDEQKKINPTDYETIKKYLSIRIYREDYVEQQGGKDNIVTKIDIEGTYTVLMLDLPEAFRTVEKSMFELWKKEQSEVFQIAQSNINQQKIDKVTKEFKVDSSEISVHFLGNEDYAASYALDLMNNSPELIGSWGSVVAVPNKGLVNICKISKEKPLDFVKFIQFIKKPVERFYSKHPQPISNQFFWYYKGKFKRINVLEDKNGNINVISPMGLTELMTVKR